MTAGCDLAIEQAEYVEEYILRLEFNDGKEAEVDFGDGHMVLRVES